MSINSQRQNRKKLRKIQKKTLYLKIIKPKNEINEEDKRNADRISKSEGWKTVIQSPPGRGSGDDKGKQKTTVQLSKIEKESESCDTETFKVFETLKVLLAFYM